MKPNIHYWDFCAMLCAVMEGFPIHKEIEYLEKREQSNFNAQIPTISNYTNRNTTSDYISSWSIFVWAYTLPKDSRSHLLELRSQLPIT